MKTLTRSLLKKFLKSAGDRLNGDWIVIGGTVLPMLGVDFRTTIDVDIIRKSESVNDQSLELMEIASELGLPVETINQAGAFFLYKIRGFEKHLVRLHEGKKATIYVPDLYLFLKLKISRLSETDFLDCVEYISYCKKNGDLELFVSCFEFIAKELKKDMDSSERRKYLDKIQGLLN